MQSFLSEPLSTEKITVKIADLPTSLQGLKLVQLSDLHYDGLRLSDQMLAKAIAIANHAKPDLILLTGDYITKSTEPLQELVKYLKKLTSKYGIYAVLGNHDSYPKNTRFEVTKALENIDIHVLWNQIEYPFGEAFPIVGLADFYSKEFDPTPVMNQLDPNKPCLVLSHNPDSAEILKKWRVDLQLSGHTHGGQIIFPMFGPALKIYENITNQFPKQIRSFLPFLVEGKPIFYHWEWLYGLHNVGKNQLYVNRGLGTYFPGRLYCPPEVTIITLQRQ
ncbi:MAG: metallophosphoesterase [Nostocales cyanobacterium]|nr:MAG: metallophosphoesterase [Nostocales cyanobacterium]TAF14054.1 MAG: metallophosphoesterase [Nostocales cyanobacterium]